MSNLIRTEFSKYWCYLKDKPETIEGVWNFENGLQSEGQKVLTVADLNPNLVVVTGNVDQAIDGFKSFVKPLVVPNAVLGTQAINLNQADARYAPIAGGYVASVTGTANRISSSGGLNPIIDIAANYIGQSSITTLGTITTGIWQGTPIANNYIASAATWNAKQDALVSGVNIKTINGSSILSAGNLVLATIADLSGYALDTDVIHQTGNEFSITGLKRFNNGTEYTDIDGGIVTVYSPSTQAVLNYNHVGIQNTSTNAIGSLYSSALELRVGATGSQRIYSIVPGASGAAGTYTLTMPVASGTIATTSDLSNYLPTSGFTTSAINLLYGYTPANGANYLPLSAGSSNILTGALYFSPNGANNRDILLNGDNTLNGSFTLQAGGGSSGFGGSLTMRSHSHATKPGWITAGISVGSGGKFSVNNQALGDGTDVFTVDASGNVLANGDLEVSKSSPAFIFTNTGSSNKKWALVGNGNNFTIQETGVATRATFNAGGGVDISGNLTATNYLLASGNYIYFDAGVSNDYTIRKTGTSLAFQSGGNFTFNQSVSVTGNVNIGAQASAPTATPTNILFDGSYSNGTTVDKAKIWLHSTKAFGFGIGPNSDVQYFTATSGYHDFYVSTGKILSVNNTGISVTGTITGDGAGLTGTAGSLSVFDSGRWGGLPANFSFSGTTPAFIVGVESGVGVAYDVATFKTAMGISGGPFLPLTAGFSNSLTGQLFITGINNTRMLTIQGATTGYSDAYIANDQTTLRWGVTSSTGNGVNGSISSYGSFFGGGTNDYPVYLIQNNTVRATILSDFFGIGYTADPTSGNKFGVNGSSYFNGTVTASAVNGTLYRFGVGSASANSMYMTSDVSGNIILNAYPGHVKLSTGGTTRAETNAFGFAVTGQFSATGPSTIGTSSTSGSLQIVNSTSSSSVHPAILALTTQHNTVGGGPDINFFAREVGGQLVGYASIGMRIKDTSYPGQKGSLVFSTASNAGMTLDDKLRVSGDLTVAGSGTFSTGASSAAMLYTNAIASAGSASIDALLIGTFVNLTGTNNSILRGVYYNPTITNINGNVHRAWESTVGDFVIGAVPTYSTGGYKTAVINTSTNRLELIDGNAPTVDIVNTTTVNLVGGTKYYANHSGLSTGLLPTTATKGTQILMRGQGTGGWRISQNSGQIIHGASDTTTGTSGYIASQNRYDVVVLECIVANTEWLIVSNRGTLTIA